MTELDPILSGVEDLLGYEFKDRSILFQALCHRSYVYEQDLPPIESNERLEFLGDSVVELAVTTVLFEDFPDFLEGELTKLRSPLVRGKALAEIAQQLGIDKYVLLGKGEEMTGGRGKQSILADTFEAVVGALYVDGGFDVARGFVISSLEHLLHEIVKWGAGDYKSELQELSTKRKRIVPRYRIKDEGPDHFKTFHATVDIGGDQFGPVAGSSKKEAEQGAARLALLKLGWREESEEGPYAAPPARTGERPVGGQTGYRGEERVLKGTAARTDGADGGPRRVPREAAARLGRWWSGRKRGG